MVAQEELLKQLINLQKETLRWMRFQSLPALRKTLLETLDSEQKKQIYELTDGVSVSRTVAGIAKVSSVTVINYWNEWARLGILEKEGTGRSTTFKKMVSLPGLGIPVTLPATLVMGDTMQTATESENVEGEQNATNGRTD